MIIKISLSGYFNASHGLTQKMSKEDSRRMNIIKSLRVFIQIIEKSNLSKEGISSISESMAVSRGNIQDLPVETSTKLGMLASRNIESTSPQKTKPAIMKKFGQKQFDFDDASSMNLSR
jgi:hypothetical protein